MFQKKSGVLALGLLMQMIFISLSSAVAADSCPKLDEEKISKLESQVEDFKLRLFNMQNPRTQSWRAEQSEPLPCSEVDLRNAAVGAKCKTSKNMIFERVFRARFGEAWKGPDGVIWSDRIMTENPQEKPDVKACARHNGRLPTEHDLAYALKIGATEVLPNMNTPFFWVTQRGGWASQYEVVKLVSINEKTRYDSAGYYEFSIRCVGK